MTFATKIPLLALDKSHVILIGNDKGIGWKKTNRYKFIFDSIVYVLSHATKMWLF
jgi:hypothetical protein